MNSRSFRLKGKKNAVSLNVRERRKEYNLSQFNRLRRPDVQNKTTRISALILRYGSPLDWPLQTSQAFAEGKIHKRITVSVTLTVDGTDEGHPSWIY